MSAATKARYAEVDALWSAAGVKGREFDSGPIEPGEAMRAAKRLYRYVMGGTFTGPVKATTGNRDSYVRRGVLYANAARGWRPLVHELSHYFHYRKSDARPHSLDHARLELRMTKEVVRRGWLDGRLRDAPAPAKTPADRRSTKLASLNARIARWETKERRAHRALVKLNRQRRALERADA
jgi:hypothetical protein